uniref:Uncharacterized protein n=1 Tax=Clytia hemisphaerica TaxID=252671 RepID=A0A7M5UPF2_9CNID
MAKANRSNDKSQFGESGNDAFKRFTLDNQTGQNEHLDQFNTVLNTNDRVDYKIQNAGLQWTIEKLKGEHKMQNLKSEVALLKAQNELKDLKIEHMTLQDEKLKVVNENVALKERLSHLEEKVLKIEKENVTLVEKLNKTQIGDDKLSSCATPPKNNVKQESQQRKVWFFDRRFDSEEENEPVRDDPLKRKSGEEESSNRFMKLIHLANTGSGFTLEIFKCPGYASWYAEMLEGLRCGVDVSLFSCIMNTSKNILIIKILNTWSFPYKKPVIDIRHYVGLYDGHGSADEWRAENLKLKRLLHPHDNTVHNDLVQIDEYRWKAPFIVNEKRFLVFFMKY